MTTGDAVKVTAFVRVPVADAFAAFTEDIDLWWRRGPAYRAGGRWPSTMHLEPKLGGRVFEQLASPEPVLREIGAITAWDPPGHLAMTWRAANFRPEQTTVVEIWFAPSGDGTNVTLEHRGWSAIPDDAPVRHGRTGTAFVAEIGRWWAGLLASMRAHAATDNDRSE